MTVSTTFFLQLLQHIQGKGRDDFVPAPGNRTSNICLEKTWDPQYKDTEGTCPALLIILAKDSYAVLAAHTTLIHEVGLTPRPELPLPSRAALSWGSTQLITEQTLGHLPSLLAAQPFRRELGGF